MRDHAIGREALACGHRDPHAGFDKSRRQALDRSVARDDMRPLRLQAEQVLGGATGTRAHALVEIAANEQEEQERDGGVEIDLIGALDRLVQAHGRRQEDRQRDRHIHVQAAALQSLPG